MRRTVHLLLLLVALAAAAPVAEDADQKSILQMLLTANPHENDIFDNSIIEKTRINDNEKGSQEDAGEEFSPTTEYVLDSEIEAYTEPTEEFEPEPEPELVPEEQEPEPEPEIVPEVLEPEPEPEIVPEEQSNNATKIDYIVETEQLVEPNFDTEIIEIIQLGEEYPSEVPQSPQYALNFPEVIPELESTDLVPSSVEDLYESIIEDDQYNNQEWPQRYAPGVPNYFDINAMKPESGNLNNNQDWPQRYAPGYINAMKPESGNLNNNQDWPQRYAPGYPDNQQYGQDVPYISANPQMSSNIFGNQEFPLEYIPEIQAHNPAYEFADNEPIVDTFPDVYPDPGTFLNFPEINQFGGDGMAHAAMEDITIEPIFFNQEPLIYDNTPESSMNEELPEEVFEMLDARFDTNANPEDNIEIIVLDEELIDMPATPIAGEGEQPQDSPIIVTAILQDSRPDVDMLNLFGGPEDVIIPEIEDDTLYFQDTRPDVDMLAILSGLEDTIIPEIIEETLYPLEEEDFVKEYLPGSEDFPYQTSEQDVILTDNDSFAVPNTSEFGEEDFVLDPFANLPPLIVDIEQAAFPDMALVNNPSVIPIGNGQFSPMNQNEQRIFFQDEIREFPSEPDFMGPHSQNEFSFGHNQRYAPGYPDNQQFQPHSHGEDMHYHNDMPHTYNDMPHTHNDMPHTYNDMPHTHNDMPQTYNDMPHNHNDMPHTHNDMPHDYNFENFPQNNYFEDVRGTQKRDGAHIVPDMDMDVDVIELPIIETGDMGMFNSPLMGSRNPGSTPQITVIIASKPQLKEIWSQFIRPMQQNQYSPLDMTQNQNNVPQFDSMGPYSQNQNTNQFNPNFQRQNINQQPQQNYNMHQNMNFPPKQSFNSGMGPFARNFNQPPNMGTMFPNFNMDMSNFNMDMPSFEDLPAFVDEEIERAEQMFASQQHISPYGPPMNQQTSPYGPPMSQFSNNQQTWPTRYAPNYPEYNYANNGQFYPQGNMNNQFYIP